MPELFTAEYLKGLQLQTPCFVFSKDKIIEKLKGFEAVFPEAGVFYAMKANFDPQILKVLAETGAGFEVASKFELELLKELNVPPEKIIYGTSVKPIDHIKTFYDYGVRVFACDSFMELEKMAPYAPEAKVFVRLHVDNKRSEIDLSEKFGVTPEKAVRLLQKTKELGMTPYGVSFHVGSQATDPHAWANNLEVAHGVIEEVKKEGIELEIINIGGGYPCKYTSTQDHVMLEEIVENIREKYNELGLTQKIITEPGRGLIADTGVALTSVFGRKNKDDKKWLFLDMGVYMGLFEVMAYQGSTRYRVTPLRKSDAPQTTFALAGPTGDGPDVIDREVLLPEDMQNGDVLVVHDIGAYSLPCICNFHAFPSPRVYLV